MTKKRLILYWVLAAVIALSYFCFCAEVFGQWQSGVKPILGRQVKWAHPLSKGLVVLWPFNEGTGNKVFDLSGNGNHSNTFVGTAPTWTGGKYGSAVLFPGTDEYAEIPDSPSLRSTEITVSIVVNVSAFNAYCGIITKEEYSDKNSWRLYFGAAGNNVRFLIDKLGNLATFGYSEAPINLNEWVHIVGTYDGTIIRLYINGVLKDSDVFTDGMAQWDAPIRIATLGGVGHTEFLACIVSHATIWNRALSASEVNQLYREPFCMFEGDISVAQMYDYGEAPAPSGQFITIQMTAIPLFILFTAICFVKGRK